MNPEIKAEWLKALRSGDYKQGDQRLKGRNDYDDTVRHCCLGVLCELAAEKINISVTNWEPSDDFTEYLFDDCEALLPKSVIEWSGLETHNPIVTDPSTGEQTSIADLNDGGYSFAEIADVIEKQL